MIPRLLLAIVVISAMLLVLSLVGFVIPKIIILGITFVVISLNFSILLRDLYSWFTEEKE